VVCDAVRKISFTFGMPVIVTNSGKIAQQENIINTSVRHEAVTRTTQPFSDLVPTS